MRYRLAAASGLVVAAAASAATMHYFGAPPNIELLMPFVLASGLMLGPAAGFASGLLMRALYDFFIAWPGPWTTAPAFSYGVVGLLAGLVPLLAHGRRTFSRIEITAMAVAFTLVYDFLTLLAFSAMFGLPLLLALGPQVPFTINHVLGNALFAFAFTPLLNSVLSKVCLLDAAEARQQQPVSLVQE
ncbi:ECF-type riboflavin transporter, S component [Candidatus Burarchaeum australiense]|nr:ECF-type riboflavin transporter, S component [Candidatus Burarchaeum australiense]